MNKLFKGQQFKVFAIDNICKVPNNFKAEKEIGVQKLENFGIQKFKNLCKNSIIFEFQNNFKVEADLRIQNIRENPNLETSIWVHAMHIS